MDAKQSSLEALNRAHHFPGPYVVRVIGENSPEFVARTMQAVIIVLGPQCLPRVATRQSAEGKHQSINLMVQITHAQQVLDIYQALRGLAGLHLML